MMLWRCRKRNQIIRILIAFVLIFQGWIFWKTEPNMLVSTAVNPIINNTNISNGNCCSVMNHSASNDVWQPYHYLGNCNWKLLRVTGYSINFYNELVAEDLSSSDIVCPFTVRRLYTTLRGEVDLLSPEGKYNYLNKTQSGMIATVSWCGDRKKWINHLVCGRSFIGFRKRFDISNPDVLETSYPIKTTISLIADAKQIRYDDCYLNYQLNFNGTKGLPMGCSNVTSQLPTTVKTQTSFRLFGQTLKQGWMMKTASYMGFGTTWRPESEFETAECTIIKSELTFFFGHRQMTWLLGVNIGHVIHDNLFRVFSTIHTYVDLLNDSKDKNEYLVVADGGKQGWHQGFEQTWGISPLGYIMEALMPRRPLLERGMCFKRVVFDCPTSNSMVPMEYLQRWLEKRYRMSFSPIPDVVNEKRLLLLMVRNMNSSRSIANAQEMSETAIARGWDVSVPLSPGNSSVYKRMVDLLPLFQRTSLLVGLHGSELAPMIFMPRYSVVVEIIPIHFKYVDAWYLHQANASSLHLIRWSPVNSSVEYGPRTNSYTENKYFSVLALNRTEEEGARRMRSTFRAPIEEWNQIIDIADGIFKNDGVVRNSSSPTVRFRKKRIPMKTVAQSGTFNYAKGRKR